ncbi:MAG: TolB protein [Planctomycetota bacterium]|jgi:TolB protein
MNARYRTSFASILIASFLTAAAHASQDWVAAEKGILENHVQLTSSDVFVKAGECYFSPDGRQIIFQAIEKVKEPEEHYQMYVADLVIEDSAVTGITRLKRLTPPGSASTCGWFHPTERGVVIFGCTIVPPVNPDKVGYQRDSSRYSWQFPQEMDIVRCEIAKADGTAATLERMVSDPEAYLAECVISPDGKNLVYCEHRVAEGSGGGDLWIMDMTTRRRVSAAGGSGYDGGPFFSPNGKRICYRSDRRGNDLLQIFVAELAFDRTGNVLGVEREFQLTDNVHVNWAPYWHPNGRFLVYATSEVGHDNYEVFMLDADAGSPTRYGTRKRRLTFAPKFDGLPVFNMDGTRMMWTSQRGTEKTSQVWIADFVMQLDGPPAVEAEGHGEADETADAGKEDQMQVQDPDTGMWYIYNKKTHELGVYDPNDHTVRDATEDESTRAMELFNDN